MRSGIDVLTFPSWSAAAAPSSPHAHMITALEHRKKVTDYFVMCLASFPNSHTPCFIASTGCVTLANTRPCSGQKTTPGYEARGVWDSSLGARLGCALFSDVLLLFFCSTSKASDCLLHWSIALTLCVNFTYHKLEERKKPGHISRRGRGVPLII